MWADLHCQAGAFFPTHHASTRNLHYYQSSIILYSSVENFVTLILDLIKWVNHIKSWRWLFLDEEIYEANQGCLGKDSCLLINHLYGIVNIRCWKVAVPSCVRKPPLWWIYKLDVQVKSKTNRSYSKRASEQTLHMFFSSLIMLLLINKGQWIDYSWQYLFGTVFCDAGN